MSTQQASSSKVSSSLDTSHLKVKFPFKAKYGNYINGKFVEPKSGKYFDNTTPITNEVICKVPRSNEKDVDFALDAAHAAFPAWGTTSIGERSNILLKIADVIEKNLNVLATAECLDNGKPIRECMAADLPLVIDHWRYFAGVIRAEEGSVAEISNSEYSYHIPEPLGVVGQIIPWNFPLLIFTWKVAPALAMGNTIVIKPAKLTSLSALLFADICRSVGLPKGVVNIVTGSGSKTGTFLAENQDVAKLTFTGSTEVGKILRRKIAGTSKKITLELGGKSPFIVFEDADIDSAIEGIVDAIWFNQGQVCCAGSRLLVQESIEKDFIKKLKNRMKKLRVGSSLDKGIDIGAVVDKNQLETIEEYVKIGIDEGGEIFQPKCEIPTDGYYHLPTLFTNVSTADTIVREEIFGPVLVAMSFRTPKEAVELANNTRYGLAASIWTENLNLAFDCVIPYHHLSFCEPNQHHQNVLLHNFHLLRNHLIIYNQH